MLIDLYESDKLPELAPGARTPLGDSSKAIRKYFVATYDRGAWPWIFHHDVHASACSRRRPLEIPARQLAAAAKRAKLPSEFTAHDLRHRGVTTWLGESKSAVHVKEAMGHSSLETTLKYWHLSREHLRSLVQAHDSAPANRAGRGKR